MKTCNSARTHARTQDDHFLPFSPIFTVCCKHSSCLPRLGVCHHKFAFNNSFFLSHFLLSANLMSFFLPSVFFFFHSLSVLSAFVDIIRGEMLCLTACFLRVVKSLVKQKGSGRLRCHPFERLEGRQTDRRISRALIDLSSIRGQTQKNFTLCKLTARPWCDLNIFSQWNFYASHH